MRQSQLFGKTSKEEPKYEQSINAKLLTRAGFIDKLASGVYTYLPLGLNVLKKIQNIIREEMNALGAQEILMPAMHPEKNWSITGRWQNPGKEVMFQFQGRDGKNYGLGWTHEEIITPLAKKHVFSYKDLPMAVYQIQDKFRNEPRAKSGVLRGREFNMKDMYSFHLSEAELDNFYEKVISAYNNIFKKAGLSALVVEASGGSFSKFSHEFQVLTKYGEDLIYSCIQCGKIQNKEIVVDKKCPYCDYARKEEKSIEVGNIFKLGRKFTEPFAFLVKGENGENIPVYMGCFGIGPSRVMGAIVETSNDENGIIWPDTVSPYDIHIISIAKNPKDIEKIEEIYAGCANKGIIALYDDRNISAGQKFADADLIGISKQWIISQKTLEKGDVEVKIRATGERKIVKISKLYAQ